jgi:hypothetical protein
MIIKLVLTLASLIGLFFVVIFLIYLKATVFDGRRITRQLTKYNRIKLGRVNDFKIMNPYQGNGRYYKAQLHTHTTCSDGKLKPEELVEEYRKRDFTFLAITDHDCITDFDLYKINSSEQQMILIKGEEMTWPRPIRPFGYHINRLFIDKQIKRKDLQSIIDETHRTRGVIVINHPGFLGSLGTQQWLPEKLLEVRNYGLLEVVNHHTNTEINLRYWHALLKHFGPEEPIWGMAGDDCHTIDEIGLNYIMVRTLEISEEGLKKALKKGDFYLTQGPEVEFGVEDDLIFARIINGKAHNSKYISGKQDYEVHFLDADFNSVSSVTLGKSGETEARFKPVGNEGFIRIEVEEKDTYKKAWSQPFWLLENGAC